MGEPQGVTRVHKASKRAVKEARTEKQRFENSPLFQQAVALATQITDNPFTFGPLQREQLFRQNVGQANADANSFLTNVREKSTVGSGIRSGDVRGQEINVASGLGEALAQAFRQVALQGASSDRQDLLAAIQTALGIEGTRNMLSQNLVNAFLGQGQVLSNVAGIPSTGAQIGQGVGQLAGAFLGGAASNAGGFTQAFA